MIKDRTLVGLPLLSIPNGRRSSLQVEWVFLNASMTKMLPSCYLMQQRNGWPVREWKRWMVQLILVKGTSGGDCWWRDFHRLTTICPGILLTIRISLKLMFFRYISNNTPTCGRLKEWVLIKNFMKEPISL